MADMDGLLQVQRLRQRDHIGSVGVHVVAGIGLGRTAMAAAVMGDDPIALAEAEQHMGVPVVRAAPPAVTHEPARASRRHTACQPAYPPPPAPPPTHPPPP